MKKSNYNFIFTHNNDTYVYNSFTGAFAKTDNEFQQFLENVENDSNFTSDSQTFIQMKEAGIIVDNDYDELEKYKDLYVKSKNDKHTCAFTIAPSFSCNFNCPYCYESKNSYVMKPEHVKKMIDYIKKSTEGKKGCHITWYGGEPLICKNIIYEISEEIINYCNEKNIKYSSNIVTNGYLLTDEIISKLEYYKVNQAQITLDGDRERHNAKRFTYDGKGSYDQILANIKKLDSSNIHVNIRINVDKTNENYMDNLFEDLKQLNLTKTNIYFAFIYVATDVCASVSNSCMTNENFSYKNLTWNMKLYSNGLFKSMLQKYPNRIAAGCSALSPNSIVVDSQGYFYKCWDDIGCKEKSVGNLDEDVSMPLIPSWNLHKYLEWNPFIYEECCKCKVLPICGGYCSYLAMKDGKPRCVKWKYTLEDYLKQVIDTK